MSTKENEGLGPATPGTAARCEECEKHEGCIDEMRKDFDLTLDQQLDRAEAAEKRVAELEQALRNIAEAQSWRKLLGETAAGPAEPAKEVIPEIARLKAENASLLESLREAVGMVDDAHAKMLIPVCLHCNEKPGVEAKDTHWAVCPNHPAHIALAAAEQRAEAAEKERDVARRTYTDYSARLEAMRAERDSAEQRNTELEGALRACAKASREIANEWRIYEQATAEQAFEAVAREIHTIARAALHDEERPPEAEPLEPKFENTHAETFEDARREFGHPLSTTMDDEERSAPPRSEDGK